MKKITGILIGAMIMLGGCSNNLEHYKGTTPKADIKEFFDGKIRAWGLVQDWRGRVTVRFDVTMVGSWDGDKGRLEEEFIYYDGRKQHRTWILTKNPDGTYTGTAGDIIGEEKGKTEGGAVNWVYLMNIEVGGKIYKIKLDDWMWQMNDGILINRSYLKKFGITVAELTLFMQKQK